LRDLEELGGGPEQRQLEPARCLAQAARRSGNHFGPLASDQRLPFEPAFPDAQLLRGRRLALDDPVVRELDGPDLYLQFPFLAVAPEFEPDIPIQPLAEKTEDGPGALTFERLAVDAR